MHALKPILRIPGRGRLMWTPDEGEAIRPGGLVFATDLRATLRRGDRQLDVFELGSGLVTDAGVAYMADDFTDGTTDITNFNFHSWGTSTAAATVGQTALTTPNGSRVAGAKTNPTAPVFRTIATIAAASALSITEWGLFSATTAGTMWDRRVFTAIVVAINDSIEFTYSLTISSGG